MTGDYAYVADGRAGLWMVDVSNPTAPQEVDTYDTHAVICPKHICSRGLHLSGRRIEGVVRPALDQALY